MKNFDAVDKWISHRICRNLIDALKADKEAVMMLMTDGEFDYLVKVGLLGEDDSARLDAAREEMRCLRADCL
jgi:hypothetical protein